MTPFLVFNHGNIERFFEKLKIEIENNPMTNSLPFSTFRAPSVFA